MNNKIRILTDNGEWVEALAPVIISASRATDIPAFHARWFFECLTRGYCEWINPFNRKLSYVSFSHCRAIVFWTKNPAPVIPYLPELNKMGIHYYFHYTLNDYSREHFEPGVPSLDERIESFNRLSSLIGPKRVIWRFDPLIITPALTPRELLTRIWHIGNRIRGLTHRLVFSFVDVAAYRKVRTNLVRETGIFTPDNVLSAEPTPTQQKELIEGLIKIRDAWHTSGWDIELATCGEDIDLTAHGIIPNQCIDRNLLEKEFPEDRTLIYYLHTGRFPEADLFGEIPEIPKGYRNLKDRGQRKACGCILSKDIGMYDTCRHLCTYCYANSSRDNVLRNTAANYPV